LTIARLRNLLLVGAMSLAVAACRGDVIPLGGPIDMTIVAANIAYDPPSAVIPAGVPLRITLDNRDVDVPHNVQLLAGPGFTTVLAKSEIVSGPATTQLVTTSGLVPGNYRFACEVHPNMTSELTVQ
jgi:plastocyanin